VLLRWGLARLADLILTLYAVRPKPPFRPIFQVAASRAVADVKIIAEPPGALPEGSPVFLVETGEGLTLPETRIEFNFLELTFRHLEHTRA